MHEGDQAEVARPRAGGDQGGADGEGDDHRRPHVGLEHDQQAGGADDEQERHEALRASATRFGLRASRSAP